MNTRLLTDFKCNYGSCEAETMQKSRWLAAKRMQINQNLICLMGKPLNCCLATALPVWKRSHISAHSTEHFVLPTAIFERWICHSWKVFLLISSHSLDECMLISEITRGKPKRPKNHFAFSQRNESWCACHVLLEHAQVFPQGRPFSFQTGGPATHACALTITLNMKPLTTHN